jgi:phosphohistidine phosphatase
MLNCRKEEIDAHAMRLMLLRHAKSEKAEPGMTDRDRGLTARGRNDAARIGTYMAHHALIPDRVLVSAARRTRATWERLGPAFSSPPPVNFEDRLYNAGPDAILALLRELDRSAPAMLVIGHNPGLHEIAQILIAAGDIEARERLNEGLPTAGLAVIDFAGEDWQKLHPRSGRLERFASPRLLKAATD